MRTYIYFVFTCLIYLGTPFAGILQADEFTFLNEQGKEITVEGTQYAERIGAFTIMGRDGRIWILTGQGDLKRVKKQDPEPYDAKQFAEIMKEYLGDRIVRQKIEDPYVVNLILMAPLEQGTEAKVDAFLLKASKFFKSAEVSFQTFMKSMKIELKNSKYPLAVLIFESDRQFEEHVVKTTSNKGLSAENIAGFYDPVTNHLVLRITECASFQVPLHESIHQQVFNRSVFMRLAPSPTWFNEGIASGFEGDGIQIRTTPTKPHPLYLNLLQQSDNLNWRDLIQKDEPFRGDILAGQAYAHAWSMHWYLASYQREKYSKYVKILSEKKPLEIESPNQREEDFKKAFPEGPGNLRAEYDKKVALLSKRSPELVKPKPKYRLEKTDGLASVSMDMALNGGNAVSAGVMKNISTWRTLTFLVTCQTDAGTYCHWHLENIKPNQEVKLTPTSPNILMENSRGGNPRLFRVKVKSLLPDDPEAQKWKSGQLPKPVFNG